MLTPAAAPTTNVGSQPTGAMSDIMAVLSAQCPSPFDWHMAPCQSPGLGEYGSVDSATLKAAVTCLASELEAEVQQLEACASWDCLDMAGKRHLHVATCLRKICQRVLDSSPFFSSSVLYYQIALPKGSFFAVDRGFL